MLPRWPPTQIQKVFFSVFFSLFLEEFSFAIWLFLLSLSLFSFSYWMQVGLSTRKVTAESRKNKGGQNNLIREGISLVFQFDIRVMACDINSSPQSDMNWIYCFKNSLFNKNPICSENCLTLKKLQVDAKIRKQ